MDFDVEQHPELYIMAILLSVMTIEHSRGIKLQITPKFNQKYFPIKCPTVL